MNTEPNGNADGGRGSPLLPFVIQMHTKYTMEERLAIGKEIYNSRMTRYQAAKIYNIGADTAREYMRLYRDFNDLPPKNRSSATS